MLLLVEGCQFLSGPFFRSLFLKALIPVINGLSREVFEGGLDVCACLAVHADRQDLWLYWSLGQS